MSSSSDVLSTAHVWSIKVCDWAMHLWAIPHLHAPNEGRSQLAPGSERAGGGCQPAGWCRDSLLKRLCGAGAAAAGTYLPFSLFFFAASFVRSEVMSVRPWLRHTVGN